MSKLTIEEFREYKRKMIDYASASEEKDEAESIALFLKTQEELLSHDLSDIPVSEWKGMILFSEDALDLSKTHANIDFSLLEYASAHSVILDGCTVKGIEAIQELDLDSISPEYKKTHPECFPSDDVPDEVKERFYSCTLTFEDVYNYPSLKQCVSSKSFSREFGPSTHLVDAIGFNYAMRLFEENPEFVIAITNRNGKRAHSVVNMPKMEPIDEDASYEEAVNYVFKGIVEETGSGFYGNLPDIEIIPQTIKDSNPGYFFEEGTIDKKLEKRFYEGKISLIDLETHKDLFEGKEISFGIRNSDDVKGIQLVFGSIEEFRSRVPVALQRPVIKYLKNNYNELYDADPSSIDVDEIYKEALRYDLSDREDLFFYTLDELYEFSKYIPVDEVFMRKTKELLVVVNCGFETLIEFNQKYGDILDSSVTPDGYKTIFELIASVLFDENKDMLVENARNRERIVNSVDELYSFLEQAVIEMRLSDNSSVKYDLKACARKLNKIFPKQFIDYELCDRVLKDNPMKERIISQLEDGFNGDTSLLIIILQEHPDLLPAVLNRHLLTNFKDVPRMRILYEGLGEERFLTLCTMYGPEITAVLQALSNDELGGFIKTVNEGDYEHQINEYVYRKIRKDIRNVDIRKLPASFRREHPELFISEDAPKELKDEFYGRGTLASYGLIDSKVLYEHPEWIPYFKNIDLTACLYKESITIFNSKNRSYNRAENLYEGLGLFFTQDEILEIIAKYGGVIKYAKVSLDETKGKEEAYEQIDRCIYNSFVERRINLTEKAVPQEFKDKHPDLFLSEDAPEELRETFLVRGITPNKLKEHPEWLPFLKGKNIQAMVSNDYVDFVKKCHEFGIDDDRIIELFNTYGDYIGSKYFDSRLINRKNVSILDDLLKEEIKHAIIDRELPYDEDIKFLLGKDHPELFLDDDAPELLKLHFYKNANYLLTFDIISQHKEWLPYLKGKNVLLSLKHSYGSSFISSALESLFNRYGPEKALAFGIRYPENVMTMIMDAQLDTLCSWYDKFSFVPHYLVMKHIPFEESDSFVAAGRKWSKLMSIKRHSLTADGKAAILKASKCFGVFDGDDEGYTMLLRLFTDIPRKLREEDMNQLEMWRDSEQDEALKEEKIKQVELIKKCYARNEDGSYRLVVDTQKDKNLVSIVRGIMEDADVPIILTPERAHQLFGGFAMKYSPGLRDFLLEHYEEIITGDNISDIAKIQRQWETIKAINGNRVLTLDLAVAFVKSNEYENVQTGNMRLANVAQYTGYDQSVFNALQEIYNHAKTRTSSSIPRVEGRHGKYRYEILRLDDPKGTAAGTQTECCQEYGNAAQSCMEQLMMTKQGRIIVVFDEEGRMVAQSWVWRNKNVLCFDNIEIPKRAFKDAERDSSREGLADEILEIYGEAAHKLLELDEKRYRKLLEEGKITEEQYEALRLRKITVGAGHNDIYEALRRNVPEDLHRVDPPAYESPINHSTHLYVQDSQSQFLLAGDEEVPESEYEALPIHMDDYEEYDDSTLTKDDVIHLKMLESEGKGSGTYLYTDVEGEDELVTKIAYRYGTNPKTTKIIMHANFAIIYDVKDDEVKLADILYTTKTYHTGEPEDISDKVAVQVRGALDQIRSSGKKINVGSLEQRSLEMCNKALSLEKELDEERGLSHGAR